METTKDADMVQDASLIETGVSSEDVFDGALLHVKCDEVRLPNGDLTHREWVKHPGAAAVVPVLPDGDIIFVRQYRYPIGLVTLEIPAGKLDSPDEDPLDCARRELSEETGYAAEHFEKLTMIATTVGFSNEKIHIYAAEGLTPGKQHTDDDEFIHVVKMPLAEAVEKVKDGSIVDAKTIVGLLMMWEKMNGREESDD